MLTPTNEPPAPGKPGIAPSWTSAAKDGVGASLSLTNHCWFTMANGILTELYYPRLDQACVRDLGLIVTDGHEFFSEEKNSAKHAIAYLENGVPAYQIVSTCNQGRYRIEKQILTDPHRHVVLQRTRFAPMQGSLADYHVYALLNPHLENHGSGNTGWVADYNGRRMLFAERGGSALAMACSAGWLKCSAGYVGESDGWQDLRQHKQMLWTYGRADDGNVALTGEVDVGSSGGDFVLAVAFGRNAAEAGLRAMLSLLDGFEAAKRPYIEEWHRWQQKLMPLDEQSNDRPQLYRTSTAILRAHESVDFPGAMIASLSVPWGFAKGDRDLGGYHVVWTRDLAEAIGALLAAGAKDDLRRAIAYLEVTQEADGHWPQKMWVDGSPYAVGIQMDETALPVVLVHLAQHHDCLSGADLDRLWPMVRRAAGFLVRNGPATQTGRWENQGGYSTFTLACEVAALLAAAELADRVREMDIATYLRQTADSWNASIERWTYVRDTPLAKRVGVEGYYVWMAPREVGERDAASVLRDSPAAEVVSPDPLALVRFGLRRPDDPRILNTIRTIDTVLKVDTPQGPAWHRYIGDKYGEHDDGSPFDGDGRGRLWPLLTGERAHYELAAGRRDEAVRLQQTMAAFAGDGKMIPEQVWDTHDIPERGLFFGRPTGSAMPLVWAHAEYVKLCRSLRDGRVFDRPPQTATRYLGKTPSTPYATWRFDRKISAMPAGKLLRIELLKPAVVHYSTDAWSTSHDLPSRDTGLGVHVVDLPVDRASAGAEVLFTMYWPAAGRWEGQDVALRIE